jgi:hypothetical protein
MKAVVAATTHVNDAGDVSVSDEPAAETTTAEAAAAEATEVPAGMSAEAAARMPPATTGMAASEAATEMAATAAKVPTEGKRVGRREDADGNREGRDREHRLECLIDHHALQCLFERSIRFDGWICDDLLRYLCDRDHVLA